MRQVWSRWKRLVGVAATAGVVALASKLAPSLQASVPNTQVATPAEPEPALVAMREFTETLKEWLGISEESPSVGTDMGGMELMGDVCLPEDWE